MMYNIDFSNKTVRMKRSDCTHFLIHSHFIRSGSSRKIAIEIIVQMRDNSKCRCVTTPCADARQLHVLTCSAGGFISQ